MNKRTVGISLVLFVLFAVGTIFAASTTLESGTYIRQSDAGKGSNCPKVYVFSPDSRGNYTVSYHDASDDVVWEYSGSIGAGRLTLGPKGQAYRVEFSSVKSTSFYWNGVLWVKAN